MDTINVYNNQDDSIKDVEDLSKITNLKYGNDVLHPTANSIEFTEVENNGKIGFKPNPVDIRYASVFFEPRIGCCTSDPPFKLAYSIVTNAINKVTFKYELNGWVNWYAMRVDSIERGCYQDGNPCVLTQIPYATYDIERAKDLIISYVTEVLALINQEYVVIYFDSNTIFKISCTYDKDELEYGVPKLISSEVNEAKNIKTVFATIESPIVFSARKLQEAITNHNKKDQIQVPVYLQVSKYPNSLICLMTAISHQNHGDFAAPMSKFETTVKEELESSMLSFKNYTII